MHDLVHGPVDALHRGPTPVAYPILLRRRSLRTIIIAAAILVRARTARVLHQKASGRYQGGDLVDYPSRDLALFLLARGEEVGFLGLDDIPEAAISGMRGDLEASAE